MAFRGRERGQAAGSGNRGAGRAAGAAAADLIQHELGRVRGEADKAALRIRHHDAGVHRRFAPSGEMAGLLYDRLEELRVEAVGGESMAGVQGQSRQRLPRPVKASRRPASAARTRPWPRSSTSMPASGCWASS